MQLTHGRARLGDVTLQTGDGATIHGGGDLILHAESDTQAVLFELA